MDHCVTIFYGTAWELINIESRMTTPGRKALKRCIMGLLISLEVGMELCWCNMAVIIFHTLCQMRNTLSNVKSDHLIGKPQRLQEPICDICNMRQRTSAINIHHCPDWPSLRRAIKLTGTVQFHLSCRYCIFFVSLSNSTVGQKINFILGLCYKWILLRE